MALDTNNLINRIDTLVEGYTTHDLTVSDDAMRSTPEPHNEPDELDDIFGEVIHTYTRAQALADGTLVAVPERLAREAGLRAPVAITRAAWEDCVAWDDADNRRKGTIQDEDGRLWDVLWMAAAGIRRAPGSTSRISFPLYRTPRPGRARAPRMVRLDVVAGPGDDGELVLTIMQQDED
ncbi:DUF6573 family protein [Sphaerimonospora mesophila]|uniref:DUF6573 family protein n=1 Tax=Sphaerimonospora mesophila TaxID=37483 RepID=UPI000AFB7244